MRSPDAAAGMLYGCSMVDGIFSSASSPAGVAKFGIDLGRNAREDDR